MIRLDKNKTTYLMMVRQNLIKHQNNLEYEKMFRMMSPVPTLFWTEPGEPPLIQHRFDIDDKTLNNYNRANRNIIKGRFRGGNVGYVYHDEFPLFMAAYKKEIKRFNEIDEIVLRTIRHEGAMNIQMIKEITGLLSKQISPSLQKMQKAFILYEDQVDKDNDRAWYILEEEFYDMEIDKYSKEKAIEEVILRFCYLNVVIDENMVKSFTKFANKDIKNAINSLLDKGKLEKVCIEDRVGYILCDDIDVVQNISDDIPDDIFIMDLNDYLVRSYEHDLKARFGDKKYRTIHYILKKGEFIGAILGYFRYVDNELEDVQIDLPDELRKRYKDAIIKSIHKVYDKEKSPVIRYCGQEI
jgi:hypothetical protein